MSETRPLESSLPGVIPHVGVATLVRADGAHQITLCRALGRNRVALVAKRDLRLEHELAASLQYLDTCDVCDPARLLSACKCCDLHDKEIDVPELVLGFRAH